MISPTTTGQRQKDTIPQLQTLQETRTKQQNVDASATSQPSDEVEDEFSDGGVDWGKVGTIADTAQEMQAAAEREEKIAGLILEAQAAVKKIKEGRKGTGSGRPPARGPLGSGAFEAAISAIRYTLSSTASTSASTCAPHERLHSSTRASSTSTCSSSITPPHTLKGR